jgi:hypothetical protein
MKSVEIKFTEALAALDKAGKLSKFDAKLNAIKERANGKLPTIEVQLNLADETLKESRYIRKHNGPSDNGNEDVYFKETTDGGVFAEGDKLIVESLLSRGEIAVGRVNGGEITESAVRVALGQPPAAYANLTEAQKKEYDFARSIGISEADSLKVATLTPICGCV